MADETRQNDSDEQQLPANDRDLTPPRGDDLRSSATFGRADRHANADDATAGKTQEISDQGPALGTVSRETLGSAKPEVIGRGGDTIVQDRITLGRPLEGETSDDVDRRAP
jgi:hypothetical protein